MKADAQDLQAREKQEVKTDSTQTTTGRVFSPRVDIFEDGKAITIIADMPGVQTEDISIDLREDVLTLTGVPSFTVPHQERPLLQEFEVGKYLRQFTLSEVIDQKAIAATLTNGVLRVTLPKMGPAQPRKIHITED